ncbi:glycosyl hydrolase family 28-related protein [Mucilaginibacter sp.]|uniref:glycosyl hydrolase family 28-related protein n=1 Tax=Mucilaginibacter sp. TaxID=1882438 RepID=UPI0025F08BFF|nr:glycosyl hydrolase family 28-related protein [Mucilaginibacter sp.]
MKKILVIAAIFINFGCKKESVILNTPTSSSLTPVNSTQSFSTSTIYVSVKTQGAKGDGITDDTKAIRSALLYAKANGIANIYFPDGTYMIGETGDGGGTIKLVDGVGMMGTGVATCHIKLTGGRYNPNPVFYQDYIGSPSVGNLVVQGIDFDGNIANQRYDAAYQFCHAFKINNGKNIEVKNCKFQGWRGDGLLFGDTFEPTLNVRIVTNVNVHDSEFFNIYREGIMFCCVNGASFYNNNIHGDGYLVGGVDIERHSINESVLNVSVYNNTFNFTDGYGPVERGGPKVRYRRAVTMGFFYNGYANATADSLSGHHKIYNNKICQGQIDCFRIINVSISGNTITNAYENIAGVNFTTVPSINVADPGATKGLINVNVDNNIITSAMGNGISFYNYSKVTANANTITGTPLDGINILGTSGCFYGNNITNAGTVATPASGILINGNSSGLYVASNIAVNTTSGINRTTDYVVKIGSSNNGAVPPQIINNTAQNALKGVISQYYYQLNYITSLNNIAI